jgi:hypothetical protein
MKDKNYRIDETAFQEKERLKNRFGKTYFINVTDKDKEAKVFVFELGEFFITENFPLKSSDQTINGKQYIPIYVENYIKGQEYFLSNYHVKSDTLFRDSNPYIQTLHNCFFHAEPISGKNGWEYYETTFPIVISKKVVADYGFFAGILFELKQLQKKYSTLFKDFEKNCPLELPANNHKTYSHRVHILANQYKAKLGIEKEKKASEWQTERGNDAKNNYYTLHKRSVSYREVTVKELKNVIEFLKDYPEAQKIAINNLDQLERL